MIAISLYQPWASFVVQGHKQIETRSFNTKKRGPVLIHASAKMMSKKELEVYNTADEFRIHRSLCADPNALPHGAILGRANIIDAKPSSEWIEIFNYKPELDSKEVKEATKIEQYLGNYGAGRFGWLLSHPVEFSNPIPAKGDLGFWNTLNKKAFTLGENPNPTCWPCIILYYGKCVSAYSTKQECVAALHYIYKHIKELQGMATMTYNRCIEIEAYLFPNIVKIA